MNKKILINSLASILPAENSVPLSTITLNKNFSKTREASTNNIKNNNKNKNNLYFLK